MVEYGASTYGERIADIFDDLYGEIENVDAMADFLAALAKSGRALELGIGTGRVALPLAARGVEVHGIDASPTMIAKMRAKPGGEKIPVTLGDFADVPVQGLFDLIYVPFNTFFALLTQEAQVKCFQATAQHLTDDGAFVLENFIPDLTRFDRGQRTETISLGVNQVRIDAQIHDAVSQRCFVQHVLIGERGIRLYPVQLRYAWPSELDLMARLAGLELRNRYGGWQNEPFSSASVKHLSVYGREFLDARRGAPS